MAELKKAFAPYRNLSPEDQTDLATRSIALIHKSFEIVKEKLKTAYIAGQINSEEYDQGIECFDSFRREWLAMDLTRFENILFLKVMAMQYYKKAKGLKFPGDKGQIAVNEIVL